MLSCTDRTDNRDPVAKLYWDNHFDFNTYQTIPQMRIVSNEATYIYKPVAGIRLNGIEIEDYDGITVENNFSIIIIIITFSSREKMIQQWKLLTGTDKTNPMTDIPLEVDMKE